MQQVSYPKLVLLETYLINVKSMLNIFLHIEINLTIYSCPLDYKIIISKLMVLIYYKRVKTLEVNYAVCASPLNLDENNDILAQKKLSR